MQCALIKLVTYSTGISANARFPINCVFASLISPDAPIMIFFHIPNDIMKTNGFKRLKLWQIALSLSSPASKFSKLPAHCIPLCQFTNVNYQNPQGSKIQFGRGKMGSNMENGGDPLTQACKMVPVLHIMQQMDHLAMHNVLQPARFVLLIFQLHTCCTWNLRQ